MQILDFNYLYIYIYKGWLRCEIISKTGENWMKMF